MPANNTEIEKRFWDAADELRANLKLKATGPVLGLIFLRYADHKFTHVEQEYKAQRMWPARCTVNDQAVVIRMGDGSIGQAADRWVSRLME